MSNLPVRVTPQSRALARLDKSVEQELAARHGQALIARADDKIRYQLARERMADMQALGQQAAFAVTEISMVEVICADRAPHASGRLKHIADATTAALAQTIVDFGQGR